MSEATADEVMETQLRREGGVAILTINNVKRRNALSPPVRRDLTAHVKALSAEGRLSAYILIALPIGVLAFSSWSNYSYVSLLWTTIPGYVMCVAGILAMMFGIWWMRKTVTIEV